MEEKYYVVKVKDSKDWEEIHNLLCEESCCDHIPDRKVACENEMSHSDVTSLYELTDEEAEILNNHPKIDWVELSPYHYNFDQGITNARLRFNTAVKIYRDLLNNSSSIDSVSNPSNDELFRTNWALKRLSLESNSSFWTSPDPLGGYIPKKGNISYNRTGKNVDIVVEDSGVLQYHPEFMNNGVSRVRDLILDGPYHIDPDYFINNRLTIILPDDRVSSKESAAKEWWTNSSKRSPQFRNIGTISSIPYDYTRSSVLGTNLDGSTDMVESHGTACASLCAGRTFGLAFESTIWSIADTDALTSQNLPIASTFNIIKIFHINKPINPITGIKNPTVVNASIYNNTPINSIYDYFYAYRENSSGNVTADNASTTTPTFIKPMREYGGITLPFLIMDSNSNVVLGNTTLLAGTQMIQSGVIYVNCAGNINQKFDLPPGDDYYGNTQSGLDYNNYIRLTTVFNGSAVNNCINIHINRSESGISGIGTVAGSNFYPVILVGALDDEVTIGANLEQKAEYSSNGPRVDVYAPADETLAAGLPSDTNKYTRFVPSGRGVFYDIPFAGTSAATPVVTGLIALYLEGNPFASSIDVKNWLRNSGSKVLPITQLYDPDTDPNSEGYWLGKRNLRGGERRVAFNPFTIPSRMIDYDVNLSGTLGIFGDEDLQTARSQGYTDNEIRDYIDNLFARVNPNYIRGGMSNYNDSPGEVGGFGQIDLNYVRSLGFNDNEIRYFLQYEYRGNIGPLVQSLLNDLTWGSTLVPRADGTSVRLLAPFRNRDLWINVTSPMTALVRETDFGTEFGRYYSGAEESNINVDYFVAGPVNRPLTYDQIIANRATTEYERRLRSTSFVEFGKAIFT